LKNKNRIRGRIDKFFCLKKGMNYDEVISKVGRPSRFGGSGVPLYVYDLECGGFLTLNFGTYENSLQLASYTDKNGKSGDLFTMYRFPEQHKEAEREKEM
jgi:hypothetical protein